MINERNFSLAFSDGSKKTGLSLLTNYYSVSFDAEIESLKSHSQLLVDQLGHLAVLKKSFKILVPVALSSLNTVSCWKSFLGFMNM